LIEFIEFQAILSFFRTCAYFSQTKVKNLQTFLLSHCLNQRKNVCFQYYNLIDGFLYYDSIFPGWTSCPAGTRRRLTKCKRCAPLFASQNAVLGLSGEPNNFENAASANSLRELRLQCTLCAISLFKKNRIVTVK
jgi:hypothetical protein